MNEKHCRSILGLNDRFSLARTYCLTVECHRTHRDVVVGLQSFKDHNDGIWAEIPIPGDSVQTFARNDDKY
jgi:hypothetical protein